MVYGILAVLTMGIGAYLWVWPRMMYWAMVCFVASCASAGAAVWSYGDRVVVIMFFVVAVVCLVVTAITTTFRRAKPTGTYECNDCSAVWDREEINILESICPNCGGKLRHISNAPKPDYLSVDID